MAFILDKTIADTSSADSSLAPEEVSTLIRGLDFLFKISNVPETFNVNAFIKSEELLKHNELKSF